MRIIGLHWLDFSIVVLFVAIVLWLGKIAGQRTRSTEDFYIAGRKLGKVYQFFLNFGTSTNADQAVVVAREVFRQGIGGMWIQYLVLFLTPFYWFTTCFFRRVRLVTIGDYFRERFRSQFLSAAFAVFTLVMAFIGGGVGYMVAGKTLMALTPKPVEKYTPQEKLSVELFNEYQKLRENLPRGLNSEEEKRYNELNDRSKRGELRAFISYTNPLIIYLVYALVVGIYTTMGGFLAAAITDVIQGILITTFSFLLIPIGLQRIGSFAGLHAHVPDFKFQLFGSASTSDYAWYTILAMVLANLVSIVASAPGMATAGSARNEMTARFGMIGGMFFKRFIMIFWALTGLLALALYSGRLHDPDLIWGFMTLDLLFPGAIGLMLAGILAAKMSGLASQSVSYSALFIRNLYQPFVGPKSERHLINVGRVVIFVTLLGGVGAALFVGNLLDLFKYFISIPAIFGASIWLGFIWRRLTKWAVIIQIFICFTIYAVVPNLFQTLDWARTNPSFLKETRPQTIFMITTALREDVEAGRAEKVGQKIEKQHIVEPAGVFFEEVAREDPSDPASSKIGIGRFNAEIWVLSWLGIDFTRFSRAQLNATRFFFDALFPFVLLFLISFLTRPVIKPDLDRFFARVHTPVEPTEEAEKRSLENAIQHPEKFEKQKIWPGSNWEILKPSWKDVLGFGGSWLLVGVIIFLLWLMVTIQ